MPPSTQEAVGKDSLVLEEPKGYVYLGVLEERGEPAVMPLRRVLICDGLPGRCQPTVSGHTMGCLSDSTASSVSSTSSSSCGLTVRSVPDPVKGGYIRSDFSVALAVRGDSLPSAFPEMLSVGALGDKLGAFLGSYYAGRGKMPAWLETDSGYRAPDGYQGAVVNLAGRALAVLLPKGSVDAGRFATGGEVRALHKALYADKGMLFFPLEPGAWSLRHGEAVRRYATYRY